MSNNSPDPVPPTSKANTADTDDKFNKLVDMVTDLKNTTNKLSLSEKSCCDSIKTQEKPDISIECKFDMFSSQIIDVINENKSLQTKVEQLEAKLTVIESAHVNSIENNQEKIYSELIDRQYRARNIIVFNIPEFSNSLTDQLDDPSVIIELFRTIGVQIIPVCLHRFGNMSNKPRPLRVILPTPADVFEILKVKKKLLGIDKFKTIHITSDRTTQQRNYFRKIISDLKMRKDAGEAVLFIKFVNNVPTISNNDRPTPQL